MAEAEARRRLPCHGNLVSAAIKLQGVQLAFLRNVCGRLPVGIPAAAISAELAEDPCSLKWWLQLVGFALRVSDLPPGSLHREILKDNVQDALAKPSSANWAAKVVKHVRSSGLPAPLAHDGTVLLDNAFVAMLLANLVRSGRACMLPLDLCPPKGRNCAHIIIGFLTLIPCQSRTFSCPCVTDVCATCFFIGLVLTHCPLRWAGGCAWHGLPASALSAQACMWAMRGTIFLSALLMLIFLVASSIFLMIVMGPCVFSCGTRARRTLLHACCSSLVGLMRL